MTELTINLLGKSVWVAMIEISCVVAISQKLLLEAVDFIDQHKISSIPIFE